MSDLVKRLRTKFDQDDVQAAADRIERLEDVLRRAQWGFNHRRCSLCAGWNMGPNGETDYKHTKDCIIGKALEDSHA